MKLEQLTAITPDPTAYRARLASARDAFFGRFGSDGEEPRFISAPGRSEICGNHTDHNGGKVIAASVCQDTLAVCRRRSDRTVRLFSEGFGELSLSLDELSPKQDEAFTSSSLIRGIAARLSETGHNIGGFDAYIHSTVEPGSGLSSSAAFEACIATVFDRLFNGGSIDPIFAAKVGQFAENAYFGKPCGLMDQVACTLGGFVSIDFADRDNPIVRPLPAFPFGEEYELCVINCRSSHHDLNAEYAAIPAEMKAAAAVCSWERLADGNESELIARLPQIREACGDRAALRAIHFYEENKRVEAMARAIETSDAKGFLTLVRESGQSSAAFLQNLTVPTRPESQSIPLATALCATFGEDVFARVHGGGFAGTALAFVKKEESVKKAFLACLKGVFGEGSCRFPGLRAVGACEVDARS